MKYLEKLGIQQVGFIKKIAHKTISQLFWTIREGSGRVSRLQEKMFFNLYGKLSMLSDLNFATLVDTPLIQNIFDKYRK